MTTEQLEALETLAEFNDRLIKNLPTIISELSGNRQTDTDQYLKNIIDAINWEISVTNSTLAILNNEHTRIDKETFNQKMLTLNSAISTKADSEIAAALENLIPYFKQLGAAVKEVTSSPR